MKEEAMKGTATLGAVIEMVRGQSANHFDEVVRISEMEFVSLDEMWVSGVSVKVLPCAQRLLANRLGLPYAYLIKCPSDLQAENLNYWLRQEAKRRETFYCRFDGGNLRAAFSNRYVSLNHTDVVSAMMAHGFRAEQEIQFVLDDQLMVLKAPEWDRGFTIQDRDEVIPGVAFTNSETGASSFCVEVYFYRLVCTNGLIVKAAAGFSRFRHVSQRLLGRFPEMVNYALLDSQRKRENLAISVQSPVQDPIATIRKFNRQFQMDKRQAEAVEIAWAQEPGNTMFGIINAYTRAAQAPELNSEEAYKLETVGGQVLALVK
jgi:hypothetical protein